MLKHIQHALGRAGRVVINPKPGHATPKSLRGRYGSIVGGGGMFHRGTREVIPDGWSKPRIFDVGELSSLKRR